ncbi:MAG: diguanylate cyclase [bacterium]|nr:diguanylate cyclase [bacterium]
MAENPNKEDSYILNHEFQHSENGRNNNDEHHEPLENAFDALPYPFYIVNSRNGYVIKANPATGLKEGDKTYIEAEFGDIPAIKENIHDLIKEVKLSGKTLNREFSTADSTGSKKDIEIHIYPIFDDNRKISQIAIYVLDITKRKKAESEVLQEKQQITEITRIDPVTGFYNKRYLMERLTAEISRAQRSILPMALLIVELEDFEQTNDSRGRDASNEILKETAAMIKDEGRQEDVFFRYKENQFAALLIESGYAGAKRFSEHIISKIGAHAFNVNGEEIRASVSVGAACYPERSIKTAEDLLKVADCALIEAKDFGKGRAVFYQNKGTPLTEGNYKSANVETLKKTITDLGDRSKKTIVESIYDFAASFENNEYINGKSTEQIFSIAKKVSNLEEIYSVARSIDSRNPFIGEHFEWIISTIEKLADTLKISPEEVQDMKSAAALYDIGKIFISDSILHKKSPLTVEECRIIKKHPQIAFDMVKASSMLKGSLPSILHHHERYNGTGYPDGLKGEEIPLGARIISVADAYQALISDRPYRKAFNDDKALNIVEKAAGTYFDPKVVKAFVANVS